MEIKKLTSLAGDVFKQSVGVSIDIAGNTVCGPVAWPYVKRILSPVLDELKKKYPDYFPSDGGDELFSSAEQAEKIADALSNNIKLQKMLNDGFENLKSGQDEIINVLIKQGEVLEDINLTVDHIKDTSSNSLKIIEEQSREIKEIKAILKPKIQKELSVPEIIDEVKNLHYDAERWKSNSITNTAQRRLNEARGLIADGFKQEPTNADLIALGGYIEKTQSQINRSQGNYEVAISDFEKATKYFDAALKLDQSNLSALNGMVGVYLYLHDYGRAIKLGKLVTRNPDYGAAYWDLMTAIEGKIEQKGLMRAFRNNIKLEKEDLGLLVDLRDTYRRLEYLMPKQPLVFNTAEQDEVHRKLQVLERNLRNYNATNEP